MKTITLQGTEKQIAGLKPYKTIKEVEIRVYIIDSSYAIPTADEDFMTLAEEIGRVYTLEGFQKAFNEEETISSTIDYIRIINVKI